MDLIIELAKQWGPPGVVAVIMAVMLNKSEKREEKKDMRIQMLENLLVENYNERIEAADRISEAVHSSATAANNAADALKDLTSEVRSKHHG